MSVWYDRDDPANWAPDNEEPGCCPQCGGTIEVCRCGPNVQAELVCASCDNTGWITFSTSPYGTDFGFVTEAIPCPCQLPKPEPDPSEPYSYAKRRILQAAKAILRERGLDDGGEE